MARRHPVARALDVAIPGGVALGGLLGLAITDWLWPTPEALRAHGWAPGLILLASILAAGAALYALAAFWPRRGR
jgi:hypothetical protein